MANWYYSEYGQTKGPVSVRAIVDKVLKQELELDCYVMQENEPTWIRIRDVADIMKELDKPADLPHIQFNSDFSQDKAHSQEVGLYFCIPVQRFVILNILSAGMYQLYWFYRQWHYWAVKHKQAHQSFDREMARIFFVLSILNKIETDKEMNAVCRADFNGNQLFWLWLGFGVLGALLYRAAGSTTFLHEVLAIGIYILDVIFLLPVQRYINKVNAKLGKNYAKFGFMEYLAIGLGLFPVLLFLIFSLFKT